MRDARSTRSNLPSPDFRTLFEQAPGLYLVLTNELVIAAVSEAYLQATMTKREDIVGRGLFDVFPDNPDDTAATGVSNLRASLDRVLKNRAPDTMTVQKYDIRRPESEGGRFEERYWSPVNSPVLGESGQVAYIIHRVEDVTEFVRLNRIRAEQERLTEADRLRLVEERALRKKAEDSEVALRQQVSRITLLNQIARSVVGRHDLYSLFHVVLRQLENDLPIDIGAVYFCDLKTRTMTAAAHGAKNRVLATQLGVPEGTSIGVDEAGFGSCLAGEQSYVQETANAPVALLRAFANKGILSCVATPIVIDSRATGILVVGRRVADAFTTGEREFLKTLSEHVALAVEQTRLHSDLKTAYEGLRQAQNTVVQQERLRALGQMASGIAHDFNNALAPILGFSELLLDRGAADLASDVDVQKYLQFINTSAKDGARIVSRLKEFYRHREQNEVFQPVRLNQVVEQTVALTQPKWKGQAEASGRSIRVETSLNKTRTFPGNESDLREVLTNLIFNAVDAMPQGGTITLRTDEEKEHITLRVSDTGTGMTEEVQRRCLEPFFTTKGEHGTGLGLAMVHGIVRRHEGTVEIQSEIGKGTTFILRFPLQNSAELQSGGYAIGTTGQRLRVLVVEDQLQMRELVTACLTKDGHVVDSAPNGRAGLGKFTAGKFDLVITDRAMPEMSGDQLAVAIKAISPQTPILLLSGFGEFMAASGETPQGIDMILGKPVTLSALREAISKVKPKR
ncbi:MAG TPA: ATP-binding protein [Planctomycetota bacterium]|nr:ATP-binding protein [Planctomycetota bacterium]